MRTYAPAATGGRPRPPPRGAVARARRRSTTRSSRPASRYWRPFPDWLDPRIRRGLDARGIDRLYTHQAEAIEAVHAGRGRRRRHARPRRARRSATRCRSSRRSPTTRRRGRCSCSRPRRSARTRSPSSASSSRGGRPDDLGGDLRRRHAGARSARRSAAAGQVVVTNPDMLHSAILPHHTKWFQLFEQLRVIVIDELHTYRGVFGSHVANVLRRLLRHLRPLRQPPGHRLLLGDDRRTRPSSRRR